MIVEFVREFKEEDIKDGYGAEYFDNLLAATLKSTLSAKPIYYLRVTGRKETLKKFRLMRGFNKVIIKKETVKNIKIEEEVIPYCNGIEVKIEEKYSIKKDVKVELVKIEL